MGARNCGRLTARYHLWETKKAARTSRLLRRHSSIELFAKISHGKYRKHAEGDDLLNGLKLSGMEFVRADAVWQVPECCI